MCVAVSLITADSGESNADLFEEQDEEEVSVENATAEEEPATSSMGMYYTSMRMVWGRSNCRHISA